MKEIDENGDGEIDFDEFMAMMKKATENDMSWDLDKKAWIILWPLSLKFKINLGHFKELIQIQK